MSFAGTGTTPEPTSISISQIEIDNLQKDLNGWVEGRWSEVLVGQDDGEIIVKAYALSTANEVAINGYCKILKESSQKHITSEARKNLFIYQNEEVIKACI